MMKAFHTSLLTRYNQLKKRAITSLIDEDQSRSLNFFNVVKMSKGLSVTPASLRFEGKLYDNDNISALTYSFRKNFDNTSTYTIDNGNIEVIYKKYTKGDDTSLWNKFEMDINYTEVADAILSLKDKKNPGPMGIRVELFKRNYVYFTHLLTDLYNMIMINGIIPDTWKESYLLPIFKKGDKTDTSNCRGVAISSIFLKIYDKLITKRLYTTVESVISPTQHGFNEKRNIITNHIESTHFLQKALMRKVSVDVIYFDFSRAFDKLNHLLLQKKLIALGIPLQILFIIMNLVINKPYRIMAEKRKAEKLLYPNSGIPQGSHIGPILYLLYSNDINSLIQESCPGVTVLQFADDTKLLYEVNSEIDRRKLQSAINTIDTWGILNMSSLSGE